MGGALADMGDARNEYKILIGKPEGKVKLPLSLTN
jgi:hypothetical protein